MKQMRILSKLLLSLYLISPNKKVRDGINVILDIVMEIQRVLDIVVEVFFIDYIF